jgi:hypothetical protein
VPWTVSVPSFAIIVTWIYLHKQGSLLLPMLFHTSINVSAMMFGFRTHAAGRRIRLSSTSKMRR